MECLFLGVKTLNCSLYQRCEGIYQIMINLKASKKEANDFSKYVWRRYFYNKLKDLNHDSTTGFKEIAIKTLAKIITSISKPIFRDPYGIEAQITNIEKQLFFWENANEFIEPMTYFRRSGEGYGLVFEKAAIISNCNLKIAEEMCLLGQNLGTLITMRDSIQDLELDKKTGNFNPFLTWNNSEMIMYYHNYRRDLIKEISKLLKSSTKKNYENNKTSNIFHGISIFTQATINPYGLCKKQLQVKNHKYLLNNLHSLSYIIEPIKDTEQNEDTCQVNCCASTSDELCHIPNNPCRPCCGCCDTCADCGAGCSTCY